MTEYKFDLSRLISSEAFRDASADELRVLLAIMATKGADDDKIATLVGVSRARAKSARVLFEEAEIISAAGERAPTVTEEFEERLNIGEMYEVTAERCAKDIRDNSLASLIAECAELMGKAALSSEEAKIISQIYTQYTLDEEYILTLAAHIVETKGKLSATKLAADAERLVKRGIDSIDALLQYISEKEAESGAQAEFRRIAGIHNRNLSKTECELVDKWYYEFGFGEAVIGEAYDIMAMNSAKLSMPYMDKLLTAWHEAGCKTVEECRAKAERDRAEMAEARAKANESAGEKTPPRMPRVPQKEKPRYGDFDVDEAFKKSLLRSYGDPALVEKMLERERKNNKES